MSLEAHSRRGEATKLQVVQSSLFDHIPFARSKEKVCLQAMLARVEVVVAPAQGKELRVIAPLHDKPLLNDENLVGAANGREAVGNHKRRPPLHELAEASLNHGFGLRIQ